MGSMRRGLVILSFVILIFLSIQLVSAAECYLYSSNQSGCTAGNRSTVCRYNSQYNYCEEKRCWDFATNATCVNASQSGMACLWSANGFCQQRDCFSIEGATESTCVNNSWGLACQWFAGTNSCMYQAPSCTTYNGKQAECFATMYCQWNATNSNCTMPSNQRREEMVSGFSLGCSSFTAASFCANVTGCLWNSTLAMCTGPSAGITCEKINASSFCNAATQFSSCCAWSATGCNTTLATSCWDNRQSPPTGANFCDDYNAVSNQTVCSQIAGSPWYMPCKWNNKSTVLATDDRCEFNNQFFGDSSFHSYGDMGSKSMCESAGGVWKTKTVQTNDGSMRQDSWCEMKTGIGAQSCDSSCWACEFQSNGTSWPSQAAAETACRNSRLGFCKWKNATSGAPNGYGYCEQATELRNSGCGAKATCDGYKYYANPETACNNDVSCKWFVDPSNASLSWCAGTNQKTCQQSCGQCASQQTCTINGTSCQWDNSQQLCKDQSGSGGSGEVCFDAVDNDNDGLIDCADSNCFSDTFCGAGKGVANCGQYASNATCNADNGCMWSIDPMRNTASCEMAGAICWRADRDESICNATRGCRWSSANFGSGSVCEMNQTSAMSCFEVRNQSACSGNNNCLWNNQSGFGFCEAKAFACSSRYFGNMSGCLADSACAFVNDSFMPNGRCENACFSRPIGACQVDGLCVARTGFCESVTFSMGGCAIQDGNQTGCINKTGCSWQYDPNYNNNSLNKPSKGWCKDGFVTSQFMDMESGPPAILAEEACGVSSLDANISSLVDFCGLGIKDMPQMYGVGAKVANLSNSMLCKYRPLKQGGMGMGNLTSTYRIFLDTDARSQGGCNSTNNAAAGFEFYLLYTAGNTSASLNEVKIAYRCVNSSWIVSPIAISTWPEKMCMDLEAVLVGIDKANMQSYTNLFNKSAPMRIYMIGSNATGNATNPQDAIGPAYYTTGSVDFKAEDCKGLIDLDGDGCLPSEDPDCALFNRFGHIPFEDCRNGIDDNFDSKVDCADISCMFDRVSCGGNLAVDVNDVDPPKLGSSDIDEFPEGFAAKFVTFEPSNATLHFYNTNSSCSVVNKTFSDSLFIMWHSIPVDNFQYNPNRLGFSLASNTTYFYKYSLCDISGNCLISGCSNATLPSSYTSCGRSCKTYLDDFDYVRPNGTNSSSPLGFMEIRYDLSGDGTYDVNQSAGGTSSTRTMNETRQLSFMMTNPNASKQWALECINGTMPSTRTFNVSAIEMNESAGTNSTGRVGMSSSNYRNSFISDFNCQFIRVTIPQNSTDLYNCANVSGTGIVGCTNVTGNSTLISTTANTSTWQFSPSVLGFSGFGGGSGSGSGGSGSGSGGSGSGSGGGRRSRVTSSASSTSTGTSSTVKKPIATQTSKSTVSSVEPKTIAPTENPAAQGNTPVTTIKEAIESVFEPVEGKVENDQSSKPLPYPSGPTTVGILSRSNSMIIAGVLVLVIIGLWGRYFIHSRKSP